MRYPLIILGAGASHDSDKVENYSSHIRGEAGDYVPPLTANLFDRTKQHVIEILAKYQEVSQLATHANRRIARTQDLETYLENVFNNLAPNNKERYKELIALRFYLADLFKIISEKFHQSGNNYATLLKEIQDKAAGKACFINFNYDLLLEKNIPGINNSNEIVSFVNGDLKVIKIHGSCNWLHAPQIGFKSEPKSGYEHYLSQAETLFQDKSGEVMPIVNNTPNWNYYQPNNNGIDINYYIPALAIPLPGDHKHVICPCTHIKILEDCMNNVDRILMIGWRGNDTFLRDLIKKKLGSKQIKLFIVSTSKDRADQIASKFADTQFILRSCNLGGFSVFVESPELDEFFN